MRYHKKIYKLKIITGLALIPLDITADSHVIGEKTRMIYFNEDIPYNNILLSCYPVNSTIISDIIDNPNYIERDER